MYIFCISQVGKPCYAVLPDIHPSIIRHSDNSLCRPRRWSRVPASWKSLTLGAAGKSARLLSLPALRGRW